MSLYAPRQESTPKEETVHVFNYTAKDFEMDYLDDNNKSQHVVIPAVDNKAFPAPIANIVIDHLANFILNLQGFHYKTDVNLELSKIKEKITLHE